VPSDDDKDKKHESGCIVSLGQTMLSVVCAALLLGLL